MTDTIQRFANLFEAVEFLMNTFSLTNQQATHFVWDHSFRMGTDKGVWIDTRFVTVA
jgi:hypothetical protein